MGFFNKNLIAELPCAFHRNLEINSSVYQKTRYVLEMFDQNIFVSGIKLIGLESWTKLEWMGSGTELDLFEAKLDFCWSCNAIENEIYYYFCCRGMDQEREIYLNGQTAKSKEKILSIPIRVDVVE